jgi:hypothetical protein
MDQCAVAFFGDDPISRLLLVCWLVCYFGLHIGFL